MSTSTKPSTRGPAMKVRLSKRQAPETDKPKTVSEEAARAGVLRRAIEDIQLARDLGEQLTEVWEDG